MCKAQFSAPHNNMFSTHEMYRARLSFSGMKRGAKIRGRSLPKAKLAFCILLLMSVRSVRSGVNIEPRYLNLVQKWTIEPSSKTKSSVSSSELWRWRAGKCITSVFERFSSVPVCISSPKRRRWRFSRETPSTASWRDAERRASSST